MKKLVIFLLFTIFFNSCQVLQEGIEPIVECETKGLPNDHQASEKLDSLLADAEADGLVGGVVLVYSASQGHYLSAFGHSE